jgi:hypothetical protein
MNINSTLITYKVTQPPGIDKITLSTTDFAIKDIKQLAIAPNIKKQGDDHATETPLFIYKNEPINGSKAWHNAGEELGNFAVNIDCRGMQIVWNPSKMLGKLSGELSTPQEAYNTSEILQGYLKDIGISTDINSHKVSRIDLAKDRNMQDKVFTYSEALSLLNARRENKKTLYPDGLTLGNKSRQGCFYDKGLELTNEKTNQMRCELRLLKSKPIRTALDVSHFHQVKQITPEALHTCYTDYINKDLYKLGDFNQLSFDFMSEVSILKSFQKQGRNAFEKWIMLNGIDYVLNIYGNAGIKNILIHSGFSNKHVLDCMKKINTMLQINSFRTDKPTLSQKYEEIRAKFVA